MHLVSRTIATFNFDNSLLHSFTDDTNIFVLTVKQKSKHLIRLDLIAEFSLGFCYKISRKLAQILALEIRLRQVINSLVSNGFKMLKFYIFCTHLAKKKKNIKR